MAKLDRAPHLGAHQFAADVASLAQIEVGRELLEEFGTRPPVCLFTDTLLNESFASVDMAELRASWLIAEIATPWFETNW